MTGYQILQVDSNKSHEKVGRLVRPTWVVRSISKSRAKLAWAEKEMSPLTVLVSDCGQEGARLIRDFLQRG